MPSNADLDREYYLGAVSGSSALMTNADLERAYYLQMLGLSDPNLLSTADLKYKFFLANATGGNASMSIADLERMYYLASAGLSEPYNGSISDLRQTIARGNINLLTANVASGTDALGTIAGFELSSATATITSSTAFPAYALRSLRLTNTNADTNTPYITVGGAAYLGGGTIPVVVGQKYTAVVSLRSDVLTSGSYIRIYWFQSNGTTLISNSESAISNLSTMYKQYQVTATAPALAAFAQVTVFITNQSIAGSTADADNFGLWQGTCTTWSMPPGSPVWKPVNLFTANQASGGDALGNITGFGAYGVGGPRVYSTTKSKSGAGSIMISPAADGVTGVVIEGLGAILSWSVTAGKVYTFTASLIAGTVARDCSFELSWVNNTGVAFAWVYPSIPTNTLSWATGVYTAVAPVGAVGIRFSIRTSTSALTGEQTWIDNVGFWEGAGGEWSMPPPVLNTAVWRVDANKTTPVSYNLLTPNQASVEIDVSGIGSTGLASQTRTVGGLHGDWKITCVSNTLNGSLLLNGGGTYTPGQAIPVVEGKTYTFRYSVKSDNNTSLAYVRVYYWTAAGVAVSNLMNAGIALSSSWQTSSGSFITPATAVYASFRLQVVDATAIWDVDCIGFWEGVGGDWAMPGTPIQNLTPDRLTDLSGNGRDAIFGAAAAAPIVLPYTGEKYISLYSTSSNYVASGSVFAWNISYNVEINMYVAENAPDRNIFATGQGNILRLITTGGVTKLSYYWTSGTVQATNVVIPSGRHRIRFSTTTTDWQVWIDGISQGTGIHISPSAPTVTYMQPFGTGSLAFDKFYRTEVVIDGAASSQFIADPVNVDSTYTTIANTGTAGGNWTINRVATGFKAAVVDRPLVLFGGAQWATAVAGVIEAGTKTITLLIVYRRFGTAKANNFALNITTSGAPTAGELSLSYNNALSLSISTYNGTTWLERRATMPSAPLCIIGGRNDGTNGSLIIDGVAGTSGAMAFSAVGGPIQVMSDISHAWPVEGEFIAAAVWNKVLTDDQLAEVKTAILNYTV